VKADDAGGNRSANYGAGQKEDSDANDAAEKATPPTSGWTHGRSARRIHNRCSLPWGDSPKATP